jgi:hypothetical protein
MYTNVKRAIKSLEKSQYILSSVLSTKIPNAVFIQALRDRNRIADNKEIDIVDSEVIIENM